MNAPGFSAALGLGGARLNALRLRIQSMVRSTRGK